MSARKSLLLALFLGACGGSQQATETKPAETQPAETETQTAEKATESAKFEFANPGGMWMPSQLKEHGETLGKLGLEVGLGELATPTEAPLGAVVFLGGCTASFVSPEGLVITNHHCVQGALQYHSDGDNNFVENGFFAKTKKDEKWNGPAARVFVTEKQSNVTARVLSGVDKIEDGKKRFEEIEKRKKSIVAECEKDRKDIRCSVASFYRGGEFYLTEQLEIRDIRLVYAPHRGIGFYGGDEDNWMWPRHTGDFSFYRAYVGKDGKPADYSPDNVPYQPKHHLKIATGDLSEGDLVMVAGYPARTYRHKTAYEVSEATNWHYPRRIATFEEFLRELRAIEDKDAKVKAQRWIFGLENALKNSRGMLDGLAKGGLEKEKQALEAELRAWIDADEARKARFGSTLDELGKSAETSKKFRDVDAAIGELGFSQMLKVANTIVRFAEERAKKDEDRARGYQARDLPRLRDSMKAFAGSYHPELDKVLLGTALRRALRQSELSKTLVKAVGASSEASSKIKSRLDRMYAKTSLVKEETRIELLEKATTKSLKKNKDPFIRFALKLRPLYREIEEREQIQAGNEATIKPQYLAALREFSKGPLAPDANQTLRVTFGTVRGYKSDRAESPYVPFTKLSGVINKHRGKAPFDAPEKLRKAYDAKSFGEYVDNDLSEVPVNFLSDVDTTGGNSGSPTLNARGELVGLLFDGNYESMASDWVFIPSVTRSIHCDIRYVLWIMDKVDGAHRLMDEMGVKK